MNPKHLILQTEMLKRFIAIQDYRSAENTLSVLRGSVIQNTSRLDALTKSHLLELDAVPLLSLKKLIESAREELHLLHNSYELACVGIASVQHEEEYDVERLLDNLNCLKSSLTYMACRIDKAELFLQDCLARGILIRNEL